MEQQEILQSFSARILYDAYENVVWTTKLSLKPLTTVTLKIVLLWVIYLNNLVVENIF